MRITLVASGLKSSTRTTPHPPPIPKETTAFSRISARFPCFDLPFDDRHTLPRFLAHQTLPHNPHSIPDQLPICRPPCHLLEHIFFMPCLPIIYRHTSVFAAPCLPVALLDWAGLDYDNWWFPPSGDGSWLGYFGVRSIASPSIFAVFRRRQAQLTPDSSNKHGCESAKPGAHGFSVLGNPGRYTQSVVWLSLSSRPGQVTLVSLEASTPWVGWGLLFPSTTPAVSARRRATVISKVDI